MSNNLRTDDLIRALATDSGAPRAGLVPALALAALAALLVSFVMLLGTAGIRPDFMPSVRAGIVPFKLAVTLSLTVSAFLLARRAARPDDHPALWLYIVPPVAIVLTGIAYELIATRVDTTNLIGRTPLDCVGLVMLYSLPPLAGAFLVMRRGAARHPSIAGAAAGLFAAGIGASVYALHCPNDDAVFVACWYGTAVALVTLAGALLGRKLLDW